VTSVTPAKIAANDLFHCLDNEALRNESTSRASWQCQLRDERLCWVWWVSACLISIRCCGAGGAEP